MVVYNYFADVLREQTRQYGEATAAQVADHLTDYVVAGDLLSLNVLVSRLQTSGHISSLAVYDADGDLLAQAGKSEKNGPSFSRELSFQDAMVGRVTLMVADTPRPQTLPLAVTLVTLSLLLLFGFLIWRYADFIYHWLPATAMPNEHREQEKKPASEACILVIKVRPSNSLARYQERFVQAARLYQGESEHTNGDELVFVFRGEDAVFLSVCAGLLIKQLAAYAKLNITFGGAIDLVGESAGKTKKHLAYLASIAEGQLLIANKPRVSNHVQRQIRLQPFHHSLVDSDDVFEVSSLVNQELLNSQAQQLTSKA